MGRTLTVETQQEIIDFMAKELITTNYVPENKKCVEVLAKMKHTTKNPEDTPNWCSTLSDGSQIIWNRKNQQFYHLESHGITNCDYDDWKHLFPEITWTEDLEWLIINMSIHAFAFKMQLLLKWRQGKIDTLSRYVEL